MKKNLLLLFLVGVAITFTNCKKDQEEDLTVEITGEYLGGYGSNQFGEINPYEVVVVKVNNNQISVMPKSGTEFSEFQIEIEKLNDSSIASPTDDNQQLDKSVIFAIGGNVSLTLSIDPTGNAHAFTGIKQ